MLKQTQKGFTLIELMIVVAIIGILAAIALPAYQDYTIRAKISEGIIAASSAKSVVSEAFQTDGVSGVNAASIAWTANLTTTASKYVDNVTISPAGVVVVAYNATANNGLPTGIDGQTIAMTPFVANATLSPASNGAIDWACRSVGGTTAGSRGFNTATAGTLLAKYAPSECR